MPSNTFSDKPKRELVGTDSGSWFKQEQWSELFPAQQLPENNAGVASASREKIETIYSNIPAVCQSNMTASIQHSFWSTSNWLTLIGLCLFCKGGMKITTS